MRWLGCINNFPAIVIEHTALFFGQAAWRVIQNQTRAKRGECCVNMDRIRIAGEIDRMNTVIWKMPPDPFNAFQIGGKSMLNDKVFAKTQNIGRIK